MKKKLSPLITMLIITFVVMIASFVLSQLGYSSNQTQIINDNLETSVVVVNNIFSKEGFINFFTNITDNYIITQPLVNLIFALLSIGVLYSSGLLKHIFSPLKKVKSSIITAIVIFISIIATVVGDYSYLILFPLVGILYNYLNKSSILGVLTVFIGVTLGYGTGIFYNFQDFSLGYLTQMAANVEIDPNYRFDLYSSFYIMLASCFILTFLLTLLIETSLSKKVIKAETYSDELLTSKKALVISLITLAVLIGVVSIGIINGVLLDNSSDIMVNKLFSSNSPFNASFMFIILTISSIVGYTYGRLSKNYKNNLDYAWGFTKLFNNIGYLFMMMFVSSILIYVITWTNIGTVIANDLLSLITALEITGIPLMIIAFFMIIIMSFLIPGSVEKWVIISPLLIPIFMRGNLTPEFAQFIFKAADSVGKILTPVFIFFPIMLGFIQQHNQSMNKITLLGTYKLIYPILITMVVFWLIILILWYIAGLPLGFGALATF